jgi:hypothetical protein
VQDRVRDDAGEDREEQRVDQPVAEAAPEQLEDEVRAARPRGRILGPEDVDDEERSDGDTDGEAPAAIAAEDRRARCGRSRRARRS